jgi:hypothetical protein
VDLRGAHNLSHRDLADSAGRRSLFEVQVGDLGFQVSGFGFRVLEFGCGVVARGTRGASTQNIPGTLLKLFLGSLPRNYAESQRFFTFLPVHPGTFAPLSSLCGMYGMITEPSTACTG